MSGMVLQSEIESGEANGPLGLSAIQPLGFAKRSLVSTSEMSGRGYEFLIVISLSFR